VAFIKSNKMVYQIFLFIGLYAISWLLVTLSKKEEIKSKSQSIFRETLFGILLHLVTLIAFAFIGLVLVSIFWFLTLLKCTEIGCMVVLMLLAIIAIIISFIVTFSIYKKAMRTRKNNIRWYYGFMFNVAFALSASLIPIFDYIIFPSGKV
jgi:uncharacterized BrkB/YihY/UPF0761 family membrane protein